MNYEDVSEDKVTDLSPEEFSTVVLDRMKETSSDELDRLEALDNFEELLDNAVSSTLSHRVYGKQRVRVAVRKTVRSLMSELYQEEQEDKERVTVQGYWLGGEDWRHSQSPEKPPDKQSTYWITPSGVITCGVFGHSANKNLDFIPYQKYEIEYEIYHHPTNGKDYYTIKDMSLVDGSQEEFFEWVSREEIFYPEEVTNDMKYEVVFIRSPVVWVEGRKKLVEDFDNMREKKVDGNTVYRDDGRPEMVPSLVEDGVEPLIQSTQDGRDEDIFVGTLKLEAYVEEDDKYKRYPKVTFYNKRLGRHTIDVGLFRDDAMYEAIATTEPEETEELLIDEFNSQPDDLLIVAIPKYLSDYEKDGYLIENLGMNGLLVTDQYSFGDKKKD